jgi:threonine dehydratase
MLARMGGRALVFVPETTPSVKVEAMTAYGAEIRREGTDSGLCEVAARDYAAANGLVYVSPYNDPDVIAGQGTIGAEIERQAPGADMVVVSVGGGGLISGIAGHLKASNPGLQVIGAAPENDHSMLLSVKAGRAVAHEGSAPTLSDGTAGSVEPGAITVPLCATLVDEWVVVSEGEIAEAMRRYMAHDAQLIEGAAALAVAAFLKLAAARPEAVRGRSVIIVICGARIDLAKLVSIIGGQAG